jgi:tetratricopeptide (TPR) repeat protein
LTLNIHSQENQMMVDTEKAELISRPFVRIAASVGLLMVFLFMIVMAGRAGFSSLLSAHAGKTNLLASADAAVSLSPGDPDAHWIRGSLLEANRELTAAIAEYQTAASLRPDDFVLWLSLAHACELNEDSAGAIAAARRAVPLAPYYAQPHWQLGNLLVRAGQRDEGFRELRLAGASSPPLLAGIVELAWQLSAGDVQSVKEAMQPQSFETYKALAENFKKHGKVEDAIAMLGAAGDGAETVRAREQYLNELTSAGRFNEAYSLWAQGNSAASAERLGVIRDPGYEQESNLDAPGFGWRAEKRTPSVSLSLDPSNPKEGHSSLKVDFNGDSDPTTSIISQLVLIEPKTSYQLTFAYRTEELVSGGLPNIYVLDAHESKVVGHSGALSATTQGWRDVKIDFVSDESTQAVRLSLQRDRCDKSPCPIFGRLWLDGFSLQKQQERVQR